MKNRKWIKLLLVVLAFVVLGIIFTCSFNDETDGPGIELATVAQDKAVSEIKEENPTDTSRTEQTSETEELFCVYVCGEVVYPNVYYLKSGSRVHEAVSMAGGLTENADANYINMAQCVSDGQQIYIPSKDEVARGEYSLQSSIEQEDGLVNINTASVADFMTLPGIGEVKAKAIVAYRDAAGKFNSVDELKNVSGIGDSLFEQIKDKIKV